MKELGLDLFYGDSDTDIIAALKAGVHPVRVARNIASIDAYPDNYFGDVTKGDLKTRLYLIIVIFIVTGCKKKELFKK